MNNLKQKHNNLLNREEITFEVEKNSIPSKEEMKKQISEKTKKPEENVIISKINTKFGSKTFEVSAKVYDNVEDKKRYEVISRKERKKQIEEAKKAEEEKKKAEETAKKVAEEVAKAPAENTEKTKIEEKAE